MYFKVMLHCVILKHTPLMHMIQKETLKLYLGNPKVNPKLSFDFNRVSNIEIVQFCFFFFFSLDLL